jgi:pyruvate dehydrogenase E1 component beta subunit
MAVGAAACGLRPIMMWRNVTFSFVAFDQLANQAAKLRYMSGGQRACPSVFRAHGGAGIGLAAQHSQSPYAIYAQLPGLKAIVPSSPTDAVGLLRTAIRDDNPVVCFEASSLDELTEEVAGEVDPIPFGKALTRRSGADLTIVSIGPMVHAALGAAEELADEGVSVDVLDLRTIVPLDVDAVRASARRTGALLIVDEAPPQCSIAAEVAALAAEDPATWHALRAPILRVCGLPTPVPYSPPLEAAVIPSRRSIAAAARTLLV